MWSVGRSSGLAAALGVAALVLALALPAAAQPAEAEAQWEALNGQVVEAHQRGDYAAGSRLAEQAYALARQVFGERAPRTLTSLNDLAMLYARQGRSGEAEPLYRQALQLRREVLGERHPATLISLNNLAMLYARQGRSGEAEPLLQQALQLSREELGERHPATLTSLNNLAGLYDSQGRSGEAEPLYQQALQLSREVLGERHPNTLLTQLNSVAPLVNLGRAEEAVQRLRGLEPHLLARIGSELYTTQSKRVRRSLVGTQAGFQDVVLSLAVQQDSAAARQLAGTVMLRWKQLQGEEEAYLARLARRAEDPQVRRLAAEIAALRSRLARLARTGEADRAAAALAELEEKELALGRVSRDYAQHLQVRSTSLEEVQAALPSGAALVELRQYRPVDFHTGHFGAPRWAALLLAGDAVPVLADLGPVAETEVPVQTLLGDTPEPAGRDAAAALYQALFGRFEAALAGVDTVFIAPDGALALVPFGRLVLPDGRYWAQRQELRLLQTGRDLVRPDPDRPARGLLALGGIDFDSGGVAPEAGLQTGAATLPAEPEEIAAFTTAQSLTRNAFRAGFRPLPASAAEVEQVATWYRRMRRDEPVEVWSGAQASTARLLARTPPPRVLHLATHGFYLPSDGPVERPMLLSGLALAGANRALQDGSDGILYSLEAQGLNLEGTELVVLSACKTGQGSLDRSEGVYGLVRALRIAGARQVLVTLWPVDGGEARDFMVDFYRTWLA